MSRYLHHPEMPRLRVVVVDEGDGLRGRAARCEETWTRQPGTGEGWQLGAGCPGFIVTSEVRRMRTVEGMPFGSTRGGAFVYELAALGWS